ncbi:hypothetical protein BDP81DRAFT_397035 [Colletotrichum phormii]|uniref:Protein kinase domain-containing protein n=1 Tax=Colletotrichum phormii TaxID=359342 RepID=A0AAI9ZKI0_9PEZI|nr:uncharacterized protein BDP81DRAFT_397035 [Colletotrichum phormii]KAK1633680.1 hypothetical protein BDP81DRAFT_397035 [Colletotrichum phormii]
MSRPSSSRQKLKLYQYTTVQPYGQPQYENPPKLQVRPGGLRNFNPQTYVPPRKQAQIEVIELLSGGPRGGAQVLLSKIVHAPAEYRSSHAPFPGSPRKKNSGQAPSLVVAKVFDPLFFEGNNEYICALFGNDVFAEQLLSRESGAYEYIYEKGKPKGPTPHSKRKGKRWENDNSMTGHPHLTPQYYGTWAVKIERGDHKYDCAGLVLMDFTDSHGQVQRKKAELTEPFRLNVFRQIIHELVVRIHIGFEHEDFDPENIFLTFRDHGAVDDLRELHEPRPVLLDLNLSQVFCKTKDANEPDGPQHRLEWLPLPPHPLEITSRNAMGLFIGWFDPDWSTKRFDEWLVQEFGPLEEGSAEGSTGKYSTFATLDAIEAGKDEMMEEDLLADTAQMVDTEEARALALEPLVASTQGLTLEDSPAKTTSPRPSPPRADWYAEDMEPHDISSGASSRTSSRPSSRTSSRQSHRSDESTGTESGSDNVPPLRRHPSFKSPTLKRRILPSGPTSARGETEQLVIKQAGEDSGMDTIEEE